MPIADSIDTAKPAGRVCENATPNDCCIELVSQPAEDNVVSRVNETLDLADAALQAASASELLAGASEQAAHNNQADAAYELTIMVPVFNERETLPKVLERIDEVMPPRTQVIVIDDGSTDGTSQWLQSLPKRTERTVICRRMNRGKGSAVRLAIRHSQGRVVAIQDADLEYDPIDLLKVVQPVLQGDADVVYGSRYLGEISDPSLLHRFGNWALTTLSNRLTGLKLTDMETCHKAFRGELIRSIPLRECRFGFEPEITAKVAVRGASVKEVATNYQCRSYDEGKKIGWRDGVSALACMWRYRSR
ncbi:glycosyltransferase family 2 protein [Stieleria marina]|uniref:glycosyltransferase family 2 protein n=1 Tax=Stieleria marina TaxID=1930275 RepID=UPI003AF36793